MRVFLYVLIGAIHLGAATLRATTGLEQVHPSHGVHSGPYTPGTIVDLSQGRLLFVSGQWPINPQTGEKVERSIEEATVQALDNVQWVLKAGGTNFSYVFHIEVLLKNMQDLKGMEEAYTEYFPRFAPPARHTAQCDIPARIEISCIAFVPSPPRCAACEGCK